MTKVSENKQTFNITFEGLDGTAVFNPTYGQACPGVSRIQDIPQQNVSRYQDGEACEVALCRSGIASQQLKETKKSNVHPLQDDDKCVNPELDGQAIPAMDGDYENLKVKDESQA